MTAREPLWWLSTAAIGLVMWGISTYVAWALIDLWVRP